MDKKPILLLFVGAIILLAMAACSAPSAEATQTAAPVETIALNAHPTSLEGKTVVLRWNSKPNGDLYLNHVAELLTERYKDIKIIKLWETDPDTAKVSDTVEDSAAVADKIAALDPDLVIASQGDCGHCAPMLAVDQLYVEKKGIPTVTIVTTAYEEVCNAKIQEYGVPEMGFAIVEHPIAGYSPEDVIAKVDKDFPIIVAAIEWQPQ